jgi:hypothetical protein
MAEREKSSESLTRQELAVSNAYAIAALVTGRRTPPSKAKWAFPPLSAGS